MTNILILGANGQLARNTTRVILGPFGSQCKASDPDYTILRPGWFTRDEAVDYQVTQKSEPFNGHDVSLNSTFQRDERLVYIRRSAPKLGAVHGNSAW